MKEHRLGRRASHSIPLRSERCYQYLCYRPLGRDEESPIPLSSGGGRQRSLRVGARSCLAENLRGKLLLIHGTGEGAVLLGHTMRMIDALIKADKQFDLLLMPGETHLTFNVWMG